jgi:non-ribosomal peptide synthetase component F
MATLVQDILRIGNDGGRPALRKQFSLSLDAAAPAYHDRCVHELFEAQAERSPDALALISGNSEYTYRELNARANQLARFLNRFGVGPNSLVGLCVTRSPELLIGILGILKSGGAYVPLDPTHPREKLSSMLEDANVFVLLTESELVEWLPRHGGPKISLDTDWNVIAKERKTNPLHRASPRNLAYVIYNSAGSKPPKGVMISHRGLLNYLSWGAEAYEVAKGAGSVIDLSIPFDLAITRVLAPLIVGRSVLLVGDNLVSSATGTAH